MIIESVRAEFLRYKGLAEKAIAQTKDAELSAAGPGDGSSIATICRHIAGNLKSRFTDFLTTDGEKPWRHRDSEFETRSVTRARVLEHWDEGWRVLLDALGALSDAQLNARVTIRQQPLSVHEALHRSVTHVAYHVGQIVYLAKSFRGDDWDSLSIPPGQSERYNQSPDKERAR